MAELTGAATVLANGGTVQGSKTRVDALLDEPLALRPVSTEEAVRLHLHAYQNVWAITTRVGRREDDGTPVAVVFHDFEQGTVYDSFSIRREQFPEFIARLREAHAQVDRALRAAGRRSRWRGPR